MCKTCIECNSPINGRADKKFCNDDCRSAWHNKSNSDANNFVRTVNKILRRNRRILHKFYQRGETAVNRERLIEEGFAFGYYTNERIAKDGHPQKYCYEVGIVESDPRNLNLIKMSL